MGEGTRGVRQVFEVVAQPLHLCRCRLSTSSGFFGFKERDRDMLHSRSVQDHVRDSEDRDVMLFSVWLLACALLLEENYRPPRQLQTHIGKSRVCYIAAA